MAGFSYTNAEREVINAAFMAGVKRPLSDAQFQYLEALAAECPIPMTKKDANQMAKAYKRLRELALKFSPRSTHPDIFRDFERLYSQLPWPQARVANKARPRELDQFLLRFVEVYIDLGGYPSKSADSDCSRFVQAAAGRALVKAGWEMKPGTVADVIRARERPTRVPVRPRIRVIPMAAPKTGTPTLGIAQPEKPPLDDEDCK
jgi:hypothetical protein